MAKEYIEKGAVIEMYKRKYMKAMAKIEQYPKGHPVYNLYHQEAIECENIALAIKVFPAADVRENVPGEWSIAIGYDPARTWMCSECQRMTFEPSNFCPNCGADMTGGNDG